MRYRIVLLTLLPVFLLPAQDASPRPRILGVAHIAVFAADYEKSRTFYRDFLGFEEPYSLPKPDGTPSMTFFKINERQYIELFPEAAAGTDRLNHISIETDNAEAMRRYLASRGVAVPERVGKGRIGNSNFNVKDPEGHTVEIVQYEPDGWTVRERGRHVPESRISTHMMHAGIIVTRFDAEMRFYRDVLGFREIWRGTRSGGSELSWVNLQAPDGDDYIELMLYKDTPAPDRRGTAHHLALEVPDIAAAIAALEAKPSRKQYTREIQSQTGVNRKRQSNLYDPDGTRVELMEPGTVDGKPAPSSLAAPPDSQGKDAALGAFEGHADVGTVLHGGAVEFDSAKGTYTVTGSGDNMWARSDAFQYVFKKMSGDIALTADLAFLGTGGDAHRKGVLMIRQSLDADSAYVDGALHGNGLTSIQARDEKGAITHEVQSYVSGPRRLRIVKSGSDFYVSVAGEGEELHPGGGSMSVKLSEPFYVGIGVCAHNKDAVQKVVFSNVSLNAGAQSKPELYSTLVVVRLAAATDHRAVLVLPGRIESPSWTPDGASLLFRRDGKTYRVPADGGKAEEADATPTAPAQSGQVASPDGRRVAFVSYQLIAK